MTIDTDAQKIFDEISKGGEPTNLELRRAFPEISYHRICQCCAKLIRDGKVEKVSNNYPYRYKVVG